MKKNSILTLSLMIFSLCMGLLLIIYCFPSEIPLYIDINEKITALCSKWFMIFAIIILELPALLSIIYKNKIIKTFFKSVFVVILFTTSLIFAYYSIEPMFLVGTTFKIPISILTSMPLSFLIIVWANLLKILPYKSKFGIKSKYSHETEFLWIQIHYLAKDKYFFAGILLFLISLIFSIFRITLIELILFTIIIVITHCMVLHESKLIWKKYREMKNKKDELEKIKQEKNKG